MLAMMRERSPQVAIVALSHEQQRLVTLAAAVGTPIETAVNVEEALGHIRAVGAAYAGLAEPLTPRHLQILTGIAKGHSTPEVAASIGITMKTLNNHLGAVYRRLGVDNLTQAVLRAQRLGLIRL